MNGKLAEYRRRRQPGGGEKVSEKTSRLSPCKTIIIVHKVIKTKSHSTWNAVHRVIVAARYHRFRSRPPAKRQQRAKPIVIPFFH